MSLAIPENRNDAELVAASLGGDRQAFGAIVHRYQGLVTGVIYNRCQGNIARSEELAQETFLTAWQSLTSLQDANRLGAWLCGIAKNIANSATRKEAASPQSQLDAANAESSGIDPADAAISRERQELLWQALESIPETYREPMIMYYRQEKQAAEVAQALDISESTVRKRLERGRAMLKEQVIAMVEDTLSGSAPNALFTAAVIAALPVVTAKTAAAASGGAVAGVAGTKLGMTISFIIAPLLGIAGGLLGAWNGYRQARSATERRFIVRMTILIFVLVAVFVGTQMNIHHLKPYLSKTQMGLLIIGSWLLYGIVITAFAMWNNRRHRKIRENDGGEKNDVPYNSPWNSPTTQRLSIAGGCFGGASWMLGMSSQAGDWVSFAFIIVGTILLYVWASRKLAAEGWQSARKVLIATMCVLLVFSALAVNLKFNEWLMAAGASYAPGNQALAPVPLWMMNLMLVAIAVLMLGPILAIKDIGESTHSAP